ncbi:MFS transporter [Streptomyces sp. NPDC088757]|uniref:MFS transporter n=1 Tax=Streptomyces sp. NPDC088757 TaxID=3365889 RepID=UPI0037FBA2B7
MTVYLQRNFLLTYCAQFVSWFGSKLLMISYVAFIFQETSSAWLAALVFAVDWLTNLFVGLIVTQWIDRKNAKHLIVWMNVAAAVVTLAFLGFTSPEWYAGAIVIILIRGLLNSSVNAARVKALIQLFTREQTDLYAPVFGSSQPVATALAGAVGIVVLKYTSFATVIVMDAATFLLAAALVSFVRPHEDRLRESIAAGENAPNKLAGVRRAFATIAADERIASAVFYIIVSVTALQATYETLITVIPELWYEQGPSGTALFFLIDSLASAVGLFTYQYFNRRGRFTDGNHRLVSVTIVCAAMLLYAGMYLGRGRLLVCCSLFTVMVMLGSALWAHAFKMLVAATPEARIASVVGAQTAMGYSLMGVFALVFSAGLDHLGAGWTIALNAVVALALTAFWEAVVRPAVLRRADPSPVGPPAAAKTPVS